MRVSLCTRPAGRLARCAALVALLHCALGALAVGPYVCVHDGVLTNAGVPAAPPIVRELPARGGAAWQSYTASTKEWAPLRIHASFHSLSERGKHCAAAGGEVPDFRGGKVECTADGVLTPARRQILAGSIIPEAIKLHSERLSVDRVAGMLKPLMLTAATLHKECDEFPLPPELGPSGAGVDADFVLLVASSPAQTFAAVCAYGHMGRPVAGVMNFATPMIAESRFSVRIAAHEIAHALGFRRHEMDKLFFSTSRKREDGTRVFRTIMSPTVMTVVKQHYGCDSENATGGMALEGSDMQSYRKSHPHWSQRDAKDELMSAQMDPAGGFYSALTLALFHDLPYYKANLSKAESMQWGRGLGCSFFTERCKTVSSGARRPTMHCDPMSSGMQCTFSRLGMGSCQDPVAISKLQQHFANSIVISNAEPTAEYCPAITSTPTTSCIDGDAGKMPGSLVGAESRCLKTSSVLLRGSKAGDFSGDICANVQCDAATRTVKVQYKGNLAWHTCRTTLDLSKSSAFDKGTIICPDYNDVCEYSVTHSFIRLVDGAQTVLSAAAAAMLGALVALAAMG